MSTENTTPFQATDEMITRYAVRYNITLNESTKEGIVQTLNAWARGESNPDSRLTDSVETREIFKPLREAYFHARGGDSSQIAYSNVSFFDADPVIRTTDGEAPRSAQAGEVLGGQKTE